MLQLPPVGGRRGGVSWPIQRPMGPNRKAATELISADADADGHSGDQAAARWILLLSESGREASQDFPE